MQSNLPLCFLNSFRQFGMTRFLQYHGLGRMVGFACCVNPTKKLDRPQHLRVLALMEPLGKAVLGTLTDQITNCIGPTPSCDPQYAYLPSRSTNDCLMAISQHCTQVTNLVAQYARPLHSHQRNTDIPSIYGGLMLALDISKAFDSVNRSKLLAHVATLGVWHTILSC